jgi:GWxTD domain-containing protein
MHRQIVLYALLAVSLPTFAAAAARPQESSPAPPPKSAPEKRKSERRLLKELDTPYRRWLEEDVVYIISDEERRTFLQLSTNEEREQFIEQFWQRRNPDPESPDNAFKEEHYRRIAFVNIRYSSGFPGWRTDRGRIYITWGPPDEVDRHPNAGAYERKPEEGGGSTTAYPFEDWRYHHLEGIGEDIIVEFVDPTMTGEYHLTADPCEKDALAKTGAGPTLTEALGESTKSSRGINTDGSSCGKSQLFEPTAAAAFERISQYAKIQSTPPVKFKDLETLVTSKVLRNQVNFEYRFDFMRVTSDTVLVPITVQIPNRQLTFETHDGVHSAVLDVYVRVSTLTGRVVQTFQDTLNRDFPESQLRQALQNRSIYQKGVPLRPGLYRLDIVIKDVHSGNVGVVYTRLAVPKFEEDNLASSTLILADQMEHVGAKQIGLGQFVIGDTKVRPRVDQNFTQSERVGVYLQVYNLGVDEKTHKSDAAFLFLISRVDGKEAQEVFRKGETSAEQPGQTGRQVTLEKRIPLARLEPGRYKFTVQVTDNISKQTISPTADFVVKAMPAAASN